MTGTLKNTRVSLRPCSDYNPANVLQSMRDCLASLGGMSAFIKPGWKTALKVNLLQGAEPERCITTHPAIIAATAQLVREADGIPFIVDSPGAAIPHSATHLRHIYGKCGLADLGIELNEDMEVVPLPLPEGRMIHHMQALRPLVDADAIINLPKVKTHCFMVLTCAVKNMFGAVPGLEKLGYHSRLKSPERFGAMLLDILSALPPALNIVDGIEGMEGDGPSSGTSRHLGIILASESALAADLTVCRLTGIEPAMVPYLAVARERGLCPQAIDDSAVNAPESLDHMKREFQLPGTMKSGSGFFNRQMQHMANPLMNYAFSLRPFVNETACTGCGACARGCPEQIIHMRDRSGVRKAVIGYTGCIRCYCCHEMCPFKAIELRGSWLYHLFSRGRGNG